MLTGAGCSTESGIPDYRGPASLQRARKPIQYQEFIRSEQTRARYWSRSAVGWQRVASAQPNDGHKALARLENRGVVSGLITQNVDGLHHVAGSRRVVELHGSLAQVRCLSCNHSVERAEFQQTLIDLNGALLDELVAPGMESAPDGDAELDTFDGFQVPACDCGGIMKPDVVFFGENVPRERVDEAWRLFSEGDVLLIVGSSLTVFSGRRFVYRAQEQGVPIAIVNIGPTRADDVAAVKVEASVGTVLPMLAEALS